MNIEIVRNWRSRYIPGAKIVQRWIRFHKLFERQLLYHQPQMGRNKVEYKCACLINLTMRGMKQEVKNRNVEEINLREEIRE